MNTHFLQITSPFSSNKLDNDIFSLQKILESSYWASDKEGVYNFQFISGNLSAMANLQGVLYFNLYRYTPTYRYEGFAISIPGYIDRQGNIIYAEGMKGKLTNNDKILWNDQKIWYKVDKVPPPQTNLLDLDHIRDQAIADSHVLGSIVQKYYYY